MKFGRGTTSDNVSEMEGGGKGGSGQEYSEQG